MIFKPSDRDLLFHHPRVELRMPVFGANPDDWWTGGIDDVLPTGHPCAVNGENLPFLGEAWSLPWSAEQIDANTVRFSREGVITPFRIERDMELRPGEPFVRMHHRITNVGTLPFHFIWGIHPGLPVGPATHIQIPAGTGTIDESWPNDRLGPAGTTTRGRTVRSSRLEPSRPARGTSTTRPICRRAGSPCGTASGAVDSE